MGRTVMGSKLGSIRLLSGNRWLALWFLANGIAQIGWKKVRPRGLDPPPVI